MSILPPRIITLDLSTACGVAWTAPDGQPKWDVWRLEKYANRGEMLAGIRNELTDLIEQINAERLYIEQRPPNTGFRGATNSQTADQQTALESIVYLVSYDENVPLGDPLHARSIRSKMIPNGAQITTKEKTAGAIVRWCQAQGHRVFDHNAADALLMWLYVTGGPRIAATRKRKAA